MRLIDHQEYSNIWVGMWWALQTVTTVGYGDVTPKHTFACVVASFVMLEGIAFLTITIAAITSTFVARASQERKAAGEAQEDAAGERIDAQFADLSQRLHRVETMLADLSSREPFRSVLAASYSGIRKWEMKGARLRALSGGARRIRTVDLLGAMNKKPLSIGLHASPFGFVARIAPAGFRRLSPCFFITI
jgi:hypothetical protein